MQVATRLNGCELRSHFSTGLTRSNMRTLASAVTRAASSPRVARRYARTSEPWFRTRIADERAAPCARHLLAAGGIVEQRGDRLGEAQRVGGRHQQTVHAIRDDLGDASYPRGNHRSAQVQGLRQHQAERLGDTRQHDQVSRRHHVRNIAAESQKTNLASHPSDRTRSR